MTDRADQTDQTDQQGILTGFATRLSDITRLVTGFITDGDLTSLESSLDDLIVEAIDAYNYLMESYHGDD